MGWGIWTVVVALCTSSTGCMYWQVQDGPPARVLAKPRGDVQLTLSDGNVVTLRKAHIVRGAADGDQVVGVIGPTDAPRPLAVPVAKIQYIETEAVNPLTSVLALMAVAGALASVALMIDPPFSDLDLNSGSRP